MSLREQFEAWWKSQRAAYGMNIAWQAYQAGHAVNAELLEALQRVVGESVVVYDNGIHATVQITSGVLDAAEEAIKKAREE